MSTFLLWLSCLVLYLGGIAFIVYLIFKSMPAHNALRTLGNGFQEGLKFCGFLFPKRYPVELWKWETMDDEDVCEDCLERASWPPMDIADWMKEGMPRTAEADTPCGNHCRCQLIPHHPKASYKRPNHKQL